MTHDPTSAIPPPAPPEPAPQPATEPRPWGYAATLGWVVLTVIATAIAGAIVLAMVAPDGIDAYDRLDRDGALFSLVSIVTLVTEVVMLWLIAARRGPPAAYLGLVLPSRREAMRATALLVALVMATDALTYVLGRDVVTPFQVQVYESARASGALIPLWIALVIAAPVGEEIMFRGFLYRGWARTDRDRVLAIVLIAAFWAVLHSQYDWYGILQIFVIGLLLGWIRWRSGSTVLVIGLHALMNAWATVQTIIKLSWSGALTI